MIARCTVKCLRSKCNEGFFRLAPVAQSRHSVHRFAASLPPAAARLLSPLLSCASPPRRYHQPAPPLLSQLWGAGRSSEVERSLMMRWVVGSILHGVDPLSYFSFQPVLHDWCNKGRGMCYPVCGMVHIKEPLLLIDKSSLCGGSGFPFSLSEWS